MGKDVFNRREKRKYFRIIYLPWERPFLQLKNERFKVIDISKNGLKFLNNAGLPLPAHIDGTIKFTDGEILRVSGRIEWELNDYSGVYLHSDIPMARIQKEKARIKSQING
jgi:hypothetical protein